MTEQIVHSDLAIPPGEYLEEVLEDMGMSKDELAKRMGRPPSKLSHIFKGGKAITAETALQLERVVGVPAHIWLGLESEYRLTLKRQADNQAAQTDKVGAFPYAELARLGYVKATRKKAERFSELCRFLGVADLDNVGEVSRYAAAWRQAAGAKRSPSPEALAAWLRIGEREAQEIDCAPFAAQALRGAVASMRRLTRADTGDVVVARLREVLAAAGVAFVLSRHLPKTYAHGAAFWLTPKKAVVMASTRTKWADVFWFSVFHEIGHLLQRPGKGLFIECKGATRAKGEVQADRFAADSLVPREAYAAFLRAGRFGKENVRAFARQVEIDAGIVVGRLQHDKRLAHSALNGLRRRYEVLDKLRQPA